MGKTLKPTCKMCRREGVSLCGRERCAVKRRPYPPGVHGSKYARGKQRLSSYGLQLREKQKAKRLYNIMERQFRKYFEEASRRKGNTADYLVQILEARLDNVVYRLGLAATRRQARQMVSHGFFSVNGHTVDIPSYRTRVGDMVAVRAAKQNAKLLDSVKERLLKHQAPSWVLTEPAALSGKIISTPVGEELRSVFDPTIIVEFYSR